MVHRAGKLLLIAAMVVCVWGGIGLPGAEASVSPSGTWTDYGRKVPGTGTGLGQFNVVLQVAVDHESNLYVADTLNHRIQKYTAATGQWSSWGKPGGGEGSQLGEFYGPDGVAIDSYGNLYVADTLNHRIQKLDVASNVWTQWGRDDHLSGTELGEFNGPIRVDVDGEGNMYVADLSNHRIQIWRAATEQWEQWGAGGSVSGTGLGEFSAPYGISVDYDGTVYVSEAGNHRIQRRDSVTGQWTQYGKADNTAGGELGEFSNPRDVRTDHAGNLYVSDVFNHRIQKLDIASNQWSQWGKAGNQSGTGAGEFNQPSSVAFDVDGNMYVADRSNYRVQVLSAATGEWTSLGALGNASGSDPGEFASPGGVAVDSDGHIYVADANNHRIQIRNAATGEWTSWQAAGGGSGTALGEFSSPQHVAVDAAGNVYVADASNHREQRRAADTGEWTAWGTSDLTRGSEPGEFNNPRNVAIGNDGKVYVADALNHRIQIYDSVTDGWTVWSKDGGGSGTEPGEFSRPFGVDVDHEGNVYVADTFNNRVQRRDAQTGEWTVWQATGGGSGSGLGGFNRPSGVAVDGRGNLYVTETGNHRLQVLSAATGEWTQWGKSGSALGEFSSPADVEVSADGHTIYIADGSNNRLVKLELPPVAPHAPTNVSAVRGASGRATVSFDAPAYTGGAPIISYTVTSSPGGITETGSTSPITVRGLVGGRSYTFTVTATNSVGNSVYSEPSSAVVIRQAQPDDEPTMPPIDVADHENGEQPGEGTETPTQPQEDGQFASVLVNGREASAGLASQSVRDNGQSVVTVAVDADRLNDLLAAAGNQAVVTIPVAADVDAVVSELTGSMVKSMEQQGAVLRISTTRGSYTLPAERLDIDALSAHFGQSVDLQQIVVSIEISAPSAYMQQQSEYAADQGGFTIVAPPVAFTVKATYGGQVVDVTAFDAYVEREAAIPSGVHPQQITTAVVIEQDGTTRHVPTKVAVIDGRYYAVISSMTNSVYTVVWNPLQFGDMAGHWAEHAVNNLGSRMVVSGVGGGGFAPDAFVARHEYAAMLVRALGLKPEAGHTFADVASSSWYADYVSAAYAYGLVAGYADGSFGPRESITREQAISIIGRAMALAGLDGAPTESERDTVLAPFADAEDVSGYAREAVAASLKAGIVAGKGEAMLAPKDRISRAEAAMMIHKLLRQSGLID